MFQNNREKQGYHDAFFLFLVVGRLKESKKIIKRKRGERSWPLALGFTLPYTVGIEIAQSTIERRDSKRHYSD